MYFIVICFVITIGDTKLEANVCCLLKPMQNNVLSLSLSLVNKGVRCIFSVSQCIRSWLQVQAGTRGTCMKLNYAQNVNVLHWIVELYYHGILVNDGISFILVIQTFYPSALNVLYNKDVCPTSSIV